jgi:signal transduction histidine kinase/ligand-binding sensor domain-containing protein
MFPPRFNAASLPTGLYTWRVIARLAGLLALCFWASPASAQYRFDHWTADNGLPQNGVRAVVQTRDGYIWFTTFDGLVRFDGVRFTVFNKSNSPGIPGNRFFGLVEDRNGDLWASLETGEVVRRHNGRFETYTKDQGLTGEPTPALERDAEGNAVVHYNRDNFDISANRTVKFGSEAYRWSDGRFLRSENHDVSIPVERHVLPGVAAFPNFHDVSDGSIWSIVSERLYRIARDGSVRLYDARSGLPDATLALIRSADGRPQPVSRDAAGRLWLTDLETMQSRMLSAQTPEPFEIWTGFADREGNYWFSTNHAGLYCARPQSVTPYDAARGLNVREVYPLLEGRDGSIWIGSNRDGLFRFRDGSFTQYPTDDILRYFTSLFEDSAGRLWANGAFQFVDRRFVRAPWFDEVSEYFPFTCWTMCEDRDGAFWFGASDGVWRYRDGEVAHFTTKDGLAGDDTKVIVEDGKGGLWLGSYGGLTHYQDGKLTAWTEKDGLPGSAVRALKVDSDGALWIGTYDSGLGRFKDGRFTRYTTRDGLFDNGVFQILEDDDGWLWMSSNRGIYRARKQELVDFAESRTATIYCKAYNKADGMPSAECNGGRWPAGVRARDGKLWFPTMGGMAMIDPSSVRTASPPPPVVIEGMRINNKAVEGDAWDAGVGVVSGQRSAIRVEPGQDNFEIEYTALSFVNSESLRFRYKLEGADSDWVEAGTRRTAYYSHVGPGEYTFRVIAANADGRWNETGANLRVTIVPPFWRTWWFLTLAALGVAAAIAAAWRLRELQLQRRNAAQQAFARQLIASQEAERKRIAGELHDSLGQSLVIIRNWAMLGACRFETDPEAREELDEINAVASRTINEVREIAYNLGPYHLERLGFENSVRDMVRRVAQASGVAISTELEPLDGALSRDTELSLYRIAQEALNNVVKHSQASEAQVVLKREGGGVRLIVEDDGRGFDTHAPPDHSGKPGFGLNGMSERVRLLGGTLSIRSAPGQGTTVETFLLGTPS